MTKLTPWILLSFAILMMTACQPKPMSFEDSSEKIIKMMEKINWSENYSTKITSLPTADIIKIADTLPEINNKYELVVRERTSSNDVAVEIFTSTEKSGKGNDGWMVEVAQAFNERNMQLANGLRAKVFIRKIASGTGYQYIASGKYRPDAFCPSNHLWIHMSKAAGVSMTPIKEKTVRNIAGIVMKDSVYKNLQEQYGKVDVQNIIDSVIQGKLFMGYTNPFASSTGLNFLATILTIFARGDESKMLSEEAVSSFEEFQKGVPFVSLTTLQMRDSVERGGSLEAFVMEYQTYINTRSLKNGYQFIPFGILHDNPLYAVGDVKPEKLEVLKLFAKFINRKQVVQLAIRNGFEPKINYNPQYSAPAGETLIKAQQLWKKEKDSGKPILAVFLSDVSGSMRGARIKMLKNALLTGSKFIDPRNYIGMVVFNHEVMKMLPIKKFDKIHQARFLSAVQGMQVGGSTAMYDGILISAQMLLEAKQDIPDGKMMLFVLTDGITNAGYKAANARPVLEGLKIPIYTISYGEDITELKELSRINEAASLIAKETDIAYQIGNLLNAEM